MGAHRRDAHAGVAHLEPGGDAIARHPHPDATVRRSELDSVIDQIQEEPLQPPGVTCDQDFFDASHDSSTSAAWATGSSCSVTAAPSAAEIDRVACERDLARVGARQRENLRDQARQLVQFLELAEEAAAMFFGRSRVKKGDSVSARRTASGVRSS